MHMLYNSESYAVVQFEVELTGLQRVAAGAAASTGESLKRGGYEIVDKHARREIFIEGALAEHFKQGVQDLFSESTSEDDIDDYLSGYTALAQQPVVLH